MNYDLIAWLNSIMEGVQSFADILSRLPGEDVDLDDNLMGVWAEADGTIFCLDFETAEEVADWLQEFDFMEGYVIQTGYYDRLEDERNNEVDEYTGLAYITVD